MTRRLLINADDFGWAPAITDGILDAHQRGVLPSTTWIAGADAADDAVERTPGTLEVGLHLALTGVRPLSDPAPLRSLLDADGLLPRTAAPVLRWLATTPGARRAVAREWRAQYARFLDRWGRPPTHADSHQHVALAPPLHGLFVRLAAEHGVRSARAPVEVRGVADMVQTAGTRQRLEVAVFSALGGQMRRRARAAGLAVADHFAGFRQSGRMTESDLLALIARLPPGTTELMVHPGDADEPGRPGASGGYRRAAERDALVSPAVREALVRERVVLVRFDNLATA